MKDNKLKLHLDKLKELYNLFKIKEGCGVSEKALVEYPTNIDIIRWWTLFHNRKMEWLLVRRTLSEIIKNVQDDEVKAECFLGIFESYLNEFIRNRHQVDSFEKLKEAKENYLELVPNKENNGKYYYFLSRFLEAEWLKLPTIAAKHASTIIDHALKSINKSIDLYAIAESGYPAIDKKPWWLFCHKAMLLKIWKHSDYIKRLNEYGEMILEEIKKNPFKKSVQVYAATYYLLIENSSQLNRFFHELNEKIITNKSELTSHKEDSIVEVDNITYHHVELIFYNDVRKQRLYFDILTKWFQSNSN